MAASIAPTTSAIIVPTIKSTAFPSPCREKGVRLQCVALKDEYVKGTPTKHKVDGYVAIATSGIKVKEASYTLNKLTYHADVFGFNTKF